ncbi:MAG: N-acetylglucosamine-6-phosphate deacetylase, partial [Solirubrobacteraceae bacterium]|nr:N-acetylglucosamine-6-phosphate deacetylase [Solirubrobacteraceae bacterium]
ADAILTPGERLAPGWVHVREGRIAAVAAGAPPAGAAPVLRLPPGACLAPGFIDLHVHGGGGAQVGPDPAAVTEVARFHARHGTTRLLATTVPSAEDVLLDTVRAVRAAARAPADDGALIAGCHLEGPFVSPAKPGALDQRFLRPPDRGELERLLDAGEGEGDVRMIVVAPELPGALGLIAAAAEAGVVVSLGHTTATHDEARAGIERGARSATHLFNAMAPLHHREPGAAGAALASAQVTVELIADGVHVHPAILRIVHAAKGAARVSLVTDATQAAGLPDGDYRLGDQAVTMRDGQVRLAGRDTLAGSTLTMEAAVRTCVDAGIPLADAVAMASATPAALIGLGTEAGRIAPGLAADLVALDERLAVLGTMRAGTWLFRDPAWAAGGDQARNEPRTPSDGPATAPDASSARMSSSP